MFLPALAESPRTKRAVNAFGGYRHDHRAGMDRFYDMENLSADRFPLLSTRKRRARIRKLQKPNGLWTGPDGKLLWADGGTLYHDGRAVGKVADGEKQFANMGAYVLIWPDKLRYHSQEGRLEALGAGYTSSGAVSFSMCNLLGEAYGSYTAADTAPENPGGGELWLDTSAVPNVLKRYSATSLIWISLSTAYIRIGAAGIGRDFDAYDGVRIRGAELPALNTDAVLCAAGEDYLLIAGTLEKAFTQTAPLQVSREIPDFDFIFEKENRLWGCSSARREIACCKLGDARNWHCFMGISTDSYALSVGSGGDFTGACAYGPNALFFKEDRLLKIMGTRPENFQLVSTLLHGVAPGSHKSLVQLGGTLFYHARAGVFAYGGALPEYMGGDLGMRFTAAAGGAAGDKYYLSARDEAGAWHLFAYDTRASLWHREDESEALAFAACGARGYMLTGDGTLWAMETQGEEAAEERLPWFFETGELIENGYARAQKLRLRFFAQAGTNLALYLSYDGAPFEKAGHMQVRRKSPVVLPLRLRRCDSLRLRVEGEGDFTLHALHLIAEEAGE